MRLLKDKYLLDCYFQALELELERDFIDLLLKEIKRRNLKLQQERANG